MQVIRLTASTGVDLYINFAQVIFFESGRDGGTFITFSGDSPTILVKETPERVYFELRSKTN